MQIQNPTRSSHRYTQHYVAPPDKVFPLLCPVRECDWVNGWEPRLVLSETGVAEKDCIFIMPAPGAEAIWVVTEYVPHARICFVKITPGETVGFIEITLSAAPDGGTNADITYTFTALSDKGVEAVQAFTAEYYRKFMIEWETELNYFLRKGQKLPQPEVAATA